MVRGPQQQHRHRNQQSSSSPDLTIRTSIFKIYYQTIFLLEGGVEEVKFPSHGGWVRKGTEKATASRIPPWVSESLLPIGHTGCSVGWECSWTWTGGMREGRQGTVKADGEFMGRSAMLLLLDRMALLSSDSFGNFLFFKDLMGKVRKKILLCHKAF